MRTGVIQRVERVVTIKDGELLAARLDDLPLRDDLRGMTPSGAPQAPLPVTLSPRTPG